MKTDHLAAVLAAPGRLEHRRPLCPVTRAPDDAAARPQDRGVCGVMLPAPPTTEPRRYIDAAGENASSVHPRVRSNALRKAPVLL